jgi:hypothetical protein
MLKWTRIVLQIAIALASFAQVNSASAADGFFHSLQKFFSAGSNPVVITSDSDSPSARPLTLPLVLAPSAPSLSTTDAAPTVFPPLPEIPLAADDLCTLNGRERLWAQKRIDADLMSQYIDAHQLRDPQIKTRIYVLDTGFDSAHLPDMVRPDSITLEAGIYGTKNIDSNGVETDRPGDPSQDDGVSLVGDAGHDVGGHGTNVVSTIGAKNGLGVAPHADITVYRITVSDAPDKAETTLVSYINYAILRACRKGHEADPNGLTIINQSWIDRLDEIGIQTYEASYPDSLKTLLQNGCLLVKAAGNASFRAKNGDINSEIESPVLHVAATQSFDDYANFSSTGFVSAPGEHVYALESHVANTMATLVDACDKSDMDLSSPKTFIDGTSFAAPITAGVASEVVGVLRTKHQAAFEGLSGAKKVSLVIRILKASEQFGNINALRAVSIAERWDENSKSLPSVDDLQALLTQQPADVCSTLNNSREAFSLCASVQTVASAQVLSSQALTQKRYETSAGYLRAAMDLDTENASQSDLQNLKESFVQSYIKQIGAPYRVSANPSIDDYSAMSVMRVLLGASFGEYLLPAHIIATNGKDQALLFASLTAWSTENFLERGPGRGSESVLQSLIDDISLFKSMNTPAAVDSLLNRVADYRLGGLTDVAVNNANNFTALIRIINELQKRADFQDERATLNQIDARIMTALDKNPAFFGGQLDVAALSGETYDNRGYVFELIKRNEASLAPIVTDADPSHYGMVKIQYLLENPALVPADSLFPFLLKLSKLVGTNPGWSSDTSELEAMIASSMTSAFGNDDSLLPTYLQQVDWTSTTQLLFVGDLLTSVAQPVFDFQISRARTIPDSLKPQIETLKSLISDDGVHSHLPTTSYGRQLVGHIKVQVDDVPTVLPRDLVTLVNQW